MFRGKESSNRIELSRLVQDLLNFGVLGSLRLWGWGGGGVGVWGWGVVGGCPTHTVHMHMHACTCIHAQARMVNMIISCKWPPPLGESLGIPFDVICACMCMLAHACAHMWGAPSYHLPTTYTHPPPGGGTPQNQSK